MFAVAFFAVEQKHYTLDVRGVPKQLCLSVCQSIGLRQQNYMCVCLSVKRPTSTPSAYQEAYLNNTVSLSVREAVTDNLTMKMNGQDQSIPINVMLTF